MNGMTKQLGGEVDSKVDLAWKKSGRG